MGDYMRGSRWKRVAHNTTAFQHVCVHRMHTGQTPHKAQKGTQHTTCMSATFKPGARIIAAPTQRTDQSTLKQRYAPGMSASFRIWCTRAYIGQMMSVAAVRLPPPS